MKRKSAMTDRSARALEDSLDLAKLNRAANELNAEIEDVLDYQAIEEIWERDSEAENNLQ